MIFLRHALMQHALDGTEVHCVVDRELRGLEYELAAATIKTAIKQEYQKTIPLDVVIEIVADFLNETRAQRIPARERNNSVNQTNRRISDG